MDWDYEKLKGFGKINSSKEHPFGSAPFNEHLRLARHKKNAQKKLYFNAENAKRETKDLPSEKKQKQSFLPFSTKAPTKS